METRSSLTSLKYSRSHHSHMLVSLLLEICHLQGTWVLSQHHVKESEKYLFSLLIRHYLPFFQSSLQVGIVWVCLSTLCLFPVSLQEFFDFFPYKSELLQCALSGESVQKHWECASCRECSCLPVKWYQTQRIQFIDSLASISASCLFLNII